MLRIRRGKMKLKKHKVRTPVSLVKLFFIALVFFIFVTIIALYILGNRVKPVLMQLAQDDAEQAVEYAINYGISNVTLEEMRHDVDFSKEDFSKENIFKDNPKFIQKKFNDQGQVESVIFDGLEIQKFIVQRTNRIQKFLRYVEDGTITINHDEDSIININDKPIGISTEFPLGSITNIDLLNNVGPNIPIHFEPMSAVQTTLSRNVFESGINATHIQLVIHVYVEVKVVLPFVTKTTTISKDIPVDTETIPNNPPKYYNP